MRSRAAALITLALGGCTLSADNPYFRACTSDHDCSAFVCSASKHVCVLPGGEGEGAEGEGAEGEGAEGEGAEGEGEGGEGEGEGAVAGGEGEGEGVDPPIAIVSHAIAKSGGSTATTAPIDTTGASLLVACVSAVSTTGTATTSMADNMGNFWLPLTENTTDGNVMRTFYAATPTTFGAAHTFSGQGSDGLPVVAVIAVSSARAWHLVGSSGSSQSTDDVVQASVSWDAPPPSAFYLTCAGADSGTDWSSISVDSGFTITDVQLQGGAGTPENTAAASFVGTGLASPTWTSHGGNSHMNGVIAAFF